jgi:ATP-dependent RNA helicase UAP56/SUB2
MSSHDNGELIDYEDEHDVIPNGAVVATSTNGATASAADGEGDKGEKKFTGIHATGFRFVSESSLCCRNLCSFCKSSHRDFVLTPGLLRAVGHLGFGYSLEGML